MRDGVIKKRNVEQSRASETCKLYRQFSQSASHCFFSEVYMIELPKWTTVIMALKRKRSSSAQVNEYDSHQSTSSTSSTDAAENHQPVSAGEENEMPMRKMRRTDSFVKLNYRDWSSSSDQITRAEGKSNDHWRISLKYHYHTLQIHHKLNQNTTEV